MRQEVLDYIQGRNLGSFIATSELPWDENGVPLYIKNPKKIYVGREDTSTDVFLQALNGLNINTETTTVSMIFSTDAKTVNPGYDDLITELKSAKNLTTVNGIFSRNVAVSTEFEGDLQVTTIDLTFTKLQ